MKEKLKSLKTQVRGITMMALVITIIVMLILAGVSLNAMFGNHDTIDTAISAKDQAEIKSETEIVQVSANTAKGKNKYGNLKEDALKDALDTNTDGKVTDDKITVTPYDEGNIYVVEFTESQRTYKLNADDDSVEYLGKSSDLFNIGLLIAKPKSGRNAKEKYEVTLTLQALIGIDDETQYTMQYKWTTNKTEEPTTYDPIENPQIDTEKNKIVGKLDTSSLTENGTYYLWAKAQLGDGEVITRRFGPYVKGKEDELEGKLILGVNPNGGIWNHTSDISYVYGDYGDTQPLGQPESIKYGEGVIEGFEVKFKSNGGTAVSPITSTQSFSSWSVENGSVYDDPFSSWTFKFTSSQQAHVTALWSPDEIVITNPTRTGYTFAGWYTDEGCTEGHKVGTEIENDKKTKYTPTAGITLYAKWTANQYTIEYYNGGTTEIGHTKFTYDQEKKLTKMSDFESNNTKADYTFYGWTTSTTSFDREYIDEQPVKNLTAQNKGEIRLYAIWTRKVNFTSGEKGKSTAKTQEVDKYYQSQSKQYTVKAPQETQMNQITGWNLLGWRKDDSAAVSQIAPGSQVTGTDATEAQYYAVYSREVEFTTGDNKTQKATQYYSSSGKYSTAVPTPAEKPGWEPEGWRADGEPKSINDPETYPIDKPITTGDTKYYVVYKRTVDFYSGIGNTGITGATDTKVTQYYNSKNKKYSVAAPNPTAVKGWTIQGWREDTTATTKEYNPTGAITESTGHANPTDKYYAVYSRTVKFNSGLYTEGEGSKTTSQVTQYYNTNSHAVSTISMPAPDKNTYKDTGWAPLGYRADKQAKGVTDTPAGYAVTNAPANHAPAYNVLDCDNNASTTLNLYAVYERTITLNSGENKETHPTVNQKLNTYNNTVSAVSMDAPDKEKLTATGWAPLGYRPDTTAKAVTETPAGYAVTNSAATHSPAYNVPNTLYAVYKRTITVKSGLNGGTTSTKDQWLNTNNNTVTSIKLPVPNTEGIKTTAHNWEPKGYRADTVAKAVTDSPAGYAVTTAEAPHSPAYNVPNTLYAVYQRTMTFYSGLDNHEHPTRTQYMNTNANKTSLVKMPAPSLEGLDKGWARLGYRKDTTAAKPVHFAATTAAEAEHTPAYNDPDANYAVYERTITFYSGKSDSKETKTATQLLNTNNNTVTAVRFPVPTAITGWTTLGYRADDKGVALATAPAGYGYAVTNAATNHSPAYNIPNTMNAVYSRTVTFNNGDGTHETKTQYYNTQDAYTVETPTPDPIEGWIAIGFRNDNKAEEQQYDLNSVITSGDAEYNAVYKRTVKFNSGVDNVTNSTVTQYLNAKANNVSTIKAPKPSETNLSGTGWSAMGYNANKNATSTAAYPVTANNTDIAPIYTVKDPTTASSTTLNLYGVYQRTITFNSGVNCATHPTEKQYYNSNNHTVSEVNFPVPSVTNLSGTGWSAIGYRRDTTASSEAHYAVTTAVAKHSPAYNVTNTLYAVYGRNITINSGVNKATTSNTTKQYYNTKDNAVTAVSLPAPSTTGLSGTGWSALGYRADTTATQVTTSPAGYAVTTSAANHSPAYNVANTLNAVYSRTVTFKSGLNNKTSSNTTQYYNTNGNKVSQISFPAPDTEGLTDYGWAPIGYRDDTTAGDKEFAVTTSAANHSPAYTTANTMYAVYSRTLTFNSGVNKATHPTKTQYMNTNSNATSVVSMPAPDTTNLTKGWSALGYRLDSTASTATYAVTTAAANHTPEYNKGTTYNAVYSRTVTFNSGVDNATTSNTTQYYNTDGNKVSQISFPAPSTTGVADYGWAPIGYRANTTAGDKAYAVTTSAANHSPAYDVNNTMYAVYSRTAYIYSGVGKATSSSNTIQYLNTNNHAVSAISLPAPSLTNLDKGWAATGYRADTTAGDATYAVTTSTASHSPAYNVGNTTDKKLYLYAVYTRTITFNSGVNKATHPTETQKYNTNGAITAVTAKALTAIDNWTKLGYRADTTAGTATWTVTNSDVSITPAYNVSNTINAVYSRKYTATFYSGVNKATTNKTKDSDTVYYNTNTASTPTKAPITLMAASDSTDISGWNESGWRTDGSAAAKTYDYGAKPEVAWNTNFYSVYTRTAHFYSGSNNSTDKTATQYYNTNNAYKVTIPEAPAAISDWTAVGWRHDQEGGDKQHNTTGDITTAVGPNFYAVYSKSYTPTFYYWDGSKVASVTSAAKTRYLSATGDYEDVNYDIPSVITASTHKGKYNSTYIGLAKAVNTMTTVTPSTQDGNTVFYSVYRTAVDVYKPKNTTQSEKQQFYRNEFFSSKTAMADPVLSTSTTGTTQGTVAMASGYTFSKLHTAASSGGTGYTVTQAAKTTTTTFYVTETKEVTATFYYNGASGVTSTTAKGTQTLHATGTNTAAISNGSITIPDAVKNSKGTHNNSYIGVQLSTSTTAATAPSSMANIKTTVDTASAPAANTWYFAVYRTEVDIYRPTSASAVSKLQAYRNSYFTSTTALATKLAKTNDGTSDLADTDIKYSGSTLIGFANAANTNSNTYANIAALRDSSATKVYARVTDTVTATVYYNSSSTSGTYTKATKEISGTRTVYCKNDTQTSWAHANMTIPSDVSTALSGSKGKYRSTYLGLSKDLNSMTTMTPTTANTKYYAVYRETIDLYTPTSASAIAKKTAYRNEVLTDVDTMKTVLSNTNTATSNANDAANLGISFGTLIGFSASSNTKTVTYNTIAKVAESDKKPIYAIVTNGENAIIHYNSKSTSGQFEDATANAGTTTTYYCGSNSAIAVSHGTTSSVPSAVSGSVGKYNSAYKGISSSSTGITNATTFTGGSTYYAYYSSSLTVYYPTSTSAVTSSSSLALYRNEYYSSGSATTAVIASSQTSTSAINSLSISGIYGTFKGLTDTVNSTTYKAIGDVSSNYKDSSNKTFYAVVTASENATFHYNSNTTSGGFTDATATSPTTSTYYCSSTSAVGVSHGTTTTVPDAVKGTGSKGKYNSSYKGISSSSTGITNATTFTGGSTYYAYYSSALKIYYPNTSGTVSNSETALYRNEYYSSASAMTTITATSQTTTTQATNANVTLSNIKGTLQGLNTTANQGTTCSAVNTDAIKNSNTTTYYAVSSSSVNATFKYFDGTEQKETTNAGTQTYYCTSTSAMGTHNGNVTVPNTAKASRTKSGITLTYRGVSTGTDGDSGTTTPVTTGTYYVSYNKQITVKFNGNGSTSGTAPANLTPTVYMNSTGTLKASINTPANPFTKTGYTFKGWNTKADGTGTNFAASTNNTSIAGVINGETLNLYAKWTHANYTLTFNANGGSVSTTSKSVTYGQTYTDLPTPTRTGFTFKGWYAKFNGSSDYINYGRNYMYTDKISIHISAYMDNWSQYTSSNNPISCTEGGGFNIENASGKIQFANFDSGSGYKVATSNTTWASLSSGWHDFDLVFDGNYTYGYLDGTKIATSAQYTSKKIGYNTTNSVFIGAEAGGSNTYPAGAYFKGNIGNIIIKNDSNLIERTTYNTITAPAQNVTLYARWEEKSYKLQINPNGGSLDGSTSTVTRNLKYSDVSNINTPTKTGYTFAGWKELSNAKYTGNSITASVYNNNGNGVATVTSQAKSSDNPITGTTNELKIENSGTAAANPGLGGFINSQVTAANQKYVHVFVAKLPSGYYFQNANNSIGTGGSTQWLTSNEGTGSWKTYAYMVTAGSSGTFSDFGHVFVTKDINNVWGKPHAETGAYTAYIAYTNVYNITSDNTGIGQLDGTGVLTAQWKVNQYTVTCEDYFVDASNNRKVKINTTTQTKQYDYGTTAKGSDWGTGTNGSYRYHDCTSATVNETGNTLVYRYYYVWVDVNIFSPTGSQDYKSAYFSLSNDNSSWDTNLTNESAKSNNRPWGSTLYIKDLRPYYEYYEYDRCTGCTYANNQWTYKVEGPNSMCIYMKYKTFAITLNNQSATTPGTTTIYEKYNTGYYTNNTATTQMTTSANGITVPQRTGYTFGGYYTATNGGGTQYIDANGKLTSSASTTNFSAAGTLYAKWTPNKYTITFNPNGGTMNSSTSSTSYNQDYLSTITMNNPTRPGYEFMGWVSNQRTNTSTAGYWTYTDSKDPLTGNKLEIIDANHRLNGYAGGTAISSTPTSPSGNYSPSGNSTASTSTVSYTSSDPNPLKNISASTFYRLTRTSYKNVAYSNGPYLGGIHTHKDENIVYVIVARFPTGWQLEITGNTGYGEMKWLTSRAGTGKWQTYVVARTTADTGIYMDSGHMFMTNSNSSTNATNPSMDVAYLQAYYTSKQSATAGVNQFKIGATNETLTALWRAVDQTVKIAPNSSNGNYKVTASNLFDKTDMITSSGKISKKSSPQWNGASYPEADSTHTISNWLRVVPGATYKITGATEAGMVEWSTAGNKSTYFYEAATQATSYSNNTAFQAPTTYVNSSGSTVNATYTYMRFHAKTSDINNIKLEMTNSNTYTNTQTLYFPNNASISVVATPNTGYTSAITKSSGLGTLTTSKSGDVTTGSLAGIAGNAATTNLAVNFTGKTYTVTYDANGGSGAPAAQNFTFNAGEKLSSTKPTRTGYTFANWVRSDNTSYTFNPGDTIPSGWGSFTLKANWSINKYYFDVNPDSGIQSFSITGVVDPVTNAGDYYKQNDYGTTGTLSNITAKTGYTYTGYTLSGSFTAASGSSNATPKVTLGAGNGAIALNSRAHTYTVEYYDGTTKKGSSSHTYNTAKALNTASSMSMSKSGWTFDGWTTSTSATSRTYTDGQSVNNLTATDGGTITLYAIWHRTATFYSGSSNGTTKTSTQYYNSKGGNYSVAIPEAPAGITNWNTEGWRDDTSAGAKEYNTTGTLTSSANVYYGAYSRTTHFYSGQNNGTDKTATQYYNSNNAYKVTIPEAPATISNWTALGWRADNTATTAAYNKTGDITAAVGPTFRAVYSRSYTATFYSGVNKATTNKTKASSTAYFNSNSASVPTKVSITTMTAADCTDITSWTELGWKTDATANSTVTAFNTAVNVNFGTNFYAVYSRSYTATFYSGVNKATTNKTKASSTAYYNTQTTSLPTQVSITTMTATDCTDISNWTELGWRTDATANATVTAFNTAVNVAWGTNFYAVYSRSYTAHFYSGSSKTDTTVNSSTVYFNSNSASVPTTVSVTTATQAQSSDISGWTETGWRPDNTASAKSVNYNTATTVAWGTNFGSIYTQTIKLSYNGNNNTGGTVPSAQTGTRYFNAMSQNYGNPSFTAATNSLTRTGYTPNGWYNGTTNYSNGQTGIQLSANLTLYAKWKANTYTVSFNANKGSGGQSANVTATYGSAMPTISTTKPTRTGYTFAGYYDTSGTQYYTAACASARTWNKTAATTLYARWTANTYTVVYNKNASDATGTTANSSHTYGVAKNLTANGFTRNGYKFVGWATSSTGTKVYNNQQSVSNLTSTNDATYKLFAVWELDECWAEEVSYTPADSSFKKNGTNVTDVQQAIDVLYDLLD